MKRTNTNRLRSLLAKEIELVLGAGGVKGYGHIGAVRELIAAGVKIGTVTGVSVGSIVAAFLTNGYTPEQILDAFEEAMRESHGLGAFLRALSTAPDPITFAIGGWMDLFPGVQDMVKRYNLKPNARLRIVACDLLRHQPKVFEGESYDLAHAIASSCSLPGLFRPQWHFGPDGLMLLGDGAVYHYNPTEFCKGPAIVIKLTQATEVPKNLQSPLDLYFAWREIYFPLAGNQRYVDDEKNLVIEIGLPDVAGLYFGIPEEKRLAVYENGADVTRAAIAKVMAG